MTLKTLQVLTGILLVLTAGCIRISPGESELDQDTSEGQDAESGPDLEIPASGPISFRLDLIVEIDDRLTYLTQANDGSGRIFITERDGRIRILENGVLLATPFLDIEDLVDHASWEQGLLSMAFSPNYADNGEFYVYYTNLETDNDTVVARYRVSTDPNIADPDSAEQILFVEQPANNHNGGLLVYGPDGYLYIGLGDGGKGNDPWDNAENQTVLLGKILRIDVENQSTYTIPADNPYANHAEFRPEIWAYGLRNPWRFAFDLLTGDLFIADVGQNEIEEISFEAAGSAGGHHYGWDTLEGSRCFEPKEDCDQSDKIPPIHDYEHGNQHCSVTGGYVYRGQAIPALQGTYLFADYCSGIIWGLKADAAGEWQVTELVDTNLAIASFGQDLSGELYVIDLAGLIYAVRP